MASSNLSKRGRLLAVGGLASVAVLTLAGCVSTDGGSGDGGGGAIIVGTTDKVTSLDPAGAYDNGSFAVMNQVYAFLLNSPAGSGDVEPDLAESAEFTADGEYTVKLKEGLKFANGNDLTSSDVKFTFERQMTIQDPNGPWSLLSSLDGPESIETPDDLTVVFHLNNGSDQTFPQVLSSPVGPIVDEDTFPADSLASDDDIVAANAFEGQYVITDYDFNNLISYAPNEEYQGMLGEPATADVTQQFFAEASNMKLAIQQGDIDVAYRSLSATDIDDLRGDENVNIVDGPGGETRYIVFNFNTMPFGASTPEADPAKALAVRQAMADSIDRAAIADQVYKDTYTPLYSFVPQGVAGANEPLKTLYGDGNGGPDVDKAAQRLADAGVETPVTLNLQYNPDHYGESSADEYAMIKSQLEETGLFTVNLQGTEWVQYQEDRAADKYPLYQLGWFPDFSDADTYLSPFFLPENFLVNHFSDEAVTEAILAQRVKTDPDAREPLIEDAQDLVAQHLSTLPLLQGSQIAITGTDVDGAVLDGSFKFRYGTLTKG